MEGPRHELPARVSELWRREGDFLAKEKGIPVVIRAAAATVPATSGSFRLAIAIAILAVTVATIAFVCAEKARDASTHIYLCL